MSVSPVIHTVTQVTALVKGAIEDACGSLWVEGEVSGVKTYASGHTYFSLKDEGAQLKAVLFAHAAKAGGNVVPRDGEKVHAFGRMTVYEQRGDYQMIVQRIQLAGVGDLMRRYEELKRRLAAEGLFDAGRKRPLPFLPQRIGVVTSPDGAAIRDVLSVIGRRFPNLHIVIAPSRVQGDGAAQEIAAAIGLLNEVGGPGRPADSPCPPLDVILVTRGGGSLEDLWCFNEEVVAHAIANSGLPVISAVGHEIDTTLADFAADLRAATPSAAAEILVGRKEDFESGLAEASDRIRRAVTQRIALLRGRVDAARVNRVFSEPRHAVEREAQRVDLLSSRMEGALTARLAALHRRFDAAAAALTSQRGAQLPAIRARVAELESRLRQAVLLAKERTARRVATEAARLQALNPLAVLDRGYSLTRLGDGTLLTSPAQATPGLRLVTRLAKGEVASVVEGAAASVPPPAVSGAVPAKPPARRRAPRASEADLFLPGFDGDARGTP